MRRIAMLAAACAALVAAAPAHAVWLPGDLHVHTTYSHDSYGGPADDNTGPDELYTLGHSVAGDFLLARARGLRYLAITDHNDIRSQSDPGFGLGGLIAVPGYESSLHGHGQMLGARRIYDAGDESAGAVDAMARALRADGGVFQANHPIDPRWEYGYDVPVDSVEVWNLPWYYEPPLPAGSENERAVRYWHGWLDRGAHVAATGGSDSHWVTTTAAQGVGQPTTWVWAREPTAAGVLDGVRAGRTFVSSEPPALGGAQAILEADGDRDGRYEATMGDTVPAGAPVRLRVHGAAGALARVLTDGGAVAAGPVRLRGRDATVRLRAPARATWLAAEVYTDGARVARRTACDTLGLTAATPYCSSRLTMLSLTSAVYVAPASRARHVRPRR